ncbi:hypothetical protein ACFV9C_44510 [Kribbella sp. NPDC059898]|uniref:hypothetical protein n=1 Tax=Kribbella sp. NPDC059898 TaxID=3346995 RepID=UPI0036627A13
MRPTIAALIASRRRLWIQLAVAGVTSVYAFWRVTHEGGWLWATAALLSGCAFLGTYAQLEAEDHDGDTADDQETNR